MKQKELEILLSNLEKFNNPKIDLEQYQTPPRLVSMTVLRAYQLGDIENKIVADFCSGTGLFGIAASLLGAKKVYSYEIDPEAIEIAQQNAKKAGVKLYFINQDIRQIDKRFNTVLMNSPFGIRGKVKDQEFLNAALKNSETSYSFHLYKKENIEFLKKFVKKKNKEVMEIIKAEFEIPKSYFFHKKRYHIIEVAIIRCK